MNEYLVKTPEGDPLVILEAADLTDAELYAHRNLKGVNRVVPMPPADDHEASLIESFITIMGGNTELAEIAAKGRDSQESGPRRIVVPRQLAGGASEELTEAQQQRQEEIGGTLEDSFRRMGFSESAAKIAAQGRK